MDYLKTAGTREVSIITSVTMMLIITSFVGWGFIGGISMVNFLGLMLLLVEKYA